MNCFRKIMACLVLAVSTFLLVLPMSVPATETIRSGVKCQLSIEYKYDDNAIAGAEFHIYRVGKKTATGKLRLTDEFSGCQVKVDGLRESEFQIASKKLYDYVVSDGLNPDYTVITDEQGNVVVKNLKQGIYLVAGQSYMKGSQKYVTEPQLVVLPYKSNSNETWNNSLTLIPKCSVEKETTSPGEIQPTIPQTGLLWWPVPILVIAGLLMIVFGVVFRRKEQHEK